MLTLFPRRRLPLTTSRRAEVSFAVSVTLGLVRQTRTRAWSRSFLSRRSATIPSHRHAASERQRTRQMRWVLLHARLETRREPGGDHWPACGTAGWMVRMRVRRMRVAEASGGCGGGVGCVRDGESVGSARVLRVESNV